MPKCRERPIPSPSPVCRLEVASPRTTACIGKELALVSIQVHRHQLCYEVTKASPGPSGMV